MTSRCAAVLEVAVAQGELRRHEDLADVIGSGRAAGQLGEGRQVAHGQVGLHAGQHAEQPRDVDIGLAVGVFQGQRVDDLLLARSPGVVAVEVARPREIQRGTAR